MPDTLKKQPLLGCDTSDGGEAGARTVICKGQTDERPLLVSDLPAEGGVPFIVFYYLVKMWEDARRYGRGT